jgi:hypothetical protein
MHLLVEALSITCFRTHTLLVLAHIGSVSTASRCYLEHFLGTRRMHSDTLGGRLMTVYTVHIHLVAYVQYLFLLILAGCLSP